MCCVTFDATEVVVIDLLYTFQRSQTGCRIEYSYYTMSGMGGFKFPSGGPGGGGGGGPPAPSGNAKKKRRTSQNTAVPVNQPSPLSMGKLKSKTINIY